MMSLADSASGIIAPLLAGLMLAFVGLGGILLVDLVTCSVAVLAVLVVAIPQPQQTEEGRPGTMLQDARYGFRYIWRRVSLLGLQLLFFSFHLFSAAALVLFPAMILARTNDDTVILAAVQSAFGIGGVVGGLLLSTWGGPKRRINGLLLGFIGSSLLGITLLGVGKTLPIWVIAAFLMTFCGAFAYGGNQAIWQAKVIPSVQGRVFAARRLIGQASTPIGMLMGGILASRIFEPMMRDASSAGALLFAPLVGVGPGAGMALLFVLMGLAGATVGVAGYLIPPICNVEHSAGP